MHGSLYFFEKNFSYFSLKDIDKAQKIIYNKIRLRGYGSVGRAPRSQRGGQRFESAYLHQRRVIMQKSCIITRLICIFA